MMEINAPALRVPLESGEQMRRRLLELGLLRHDLKLRRDGAHLLMPMATAEPVDGHEVVEAHFTPIRPETRAYTDLLSDLPADVRGLLPTSFDVIGHVLIVKIPSALADHEAAIAQAMLKAVPRVRTIAHDDGVKGPLRTRALRVIGGEPATETEHHEFGVRIRVDPGTCYFSPRLATERHRIAMLVTPGEHVVDLMAGVAPFPLVAARHAAPAHIDAVDLNAHAIVFAKENISRNGFDERITAEAADARAWSTRHEDVADRVVTNLPHGAHAFVADALRVLKDEGTWHYHTVRAPDDLGRHLASVADQAHDEGRTLDVSATRVVRAYSPRENHYAVDFAVRRQPT